MLDINNSLPHRPFESRSKGYSCLFRFSGFRLTRILPITDRPSIYFCSSSIGVSPQAISASLRPAVPLCPTAVPRVERDTEVVENMRVISKIGPVPLIFGKSRFCVSVCGRIEAFCGRIYTVCGANDVQAVLSQLRFGHKGSCPGQDLNLRSDRTLSSAFGYAFLQCEEACLSAPQIGKPRSFFKDQTGSVERVRFVLGTDCARDHRAKRPASDENS